MIDLLIYMVGYESRSGHAVGKISHRSTLGVAASRNKLLHFEENLRGAEERGSILLDEAQLTDRLPEELSTFLEKHVADAGEDRTPRVAVDVSSMSRHVMAAVLANVYALAVKEQIHLSILYCPGSYHEPPPATASALDLSAVEGLEGWSVYPERPLSVIVGLGYEPELASAAIEYLDPSGTWVYVADSREPRFRAAAMEANSSIMHVVDRRRIVDYDPAEPKKLFAEMLLLAETLAKQSRVVIVTGGPKIFGAIAMLIKLRVGDEVAVWRVSMHDYMPIKDTAAEGDIVEFEFIPSDFDRT